MKTIKLLTLACVSLASACAVSTMPEGGGNGGATGAGNSSNTGSPAGAGGGSGSSSSGGPQVALPLTVSSDFVPSGYMGDGETPNSVAQLPQLPTDPTDCGGDRSPPALGTCYTVTYTPVSGGMGWAGIYWQYPSNNWGMQPGLDIPAGATKVSVWAKGGAGGEVLTLVAGGIMAAGDPNADTFKKTATATLTTSWAEYTITLPATYGPVLGGFAWSVGAPQDDSAVKFSIDSIQWEM